MKHYMTTLHRSVLFAPANNLKALNKFAHLSADAYVIDLEDAVADTEKDGARDQLVQWLSTNKVDCPLYVRINSISSRWIGADISALGRSNVSGFVVPKVDSVEALVELDRLLEHHQSLLRYWAMIESAQGLSNVESICSDEKLLGVMMGNNDLSADLGLPNSSCREGLSYAFSRVVLAARTNGLMVLDGVFNDINDQSTLISHSKQSKNIGFDGKTIIHPSHIDVVNDAFSPTQEQLKALRAMVQYWNEQSESARGAINYYGVMIEAMHIAQAERILTLFDNLDHG